MKWYYLIIFVAFLSGCTNTFSCGITEVQSITSLDLKYRVVESKVDCGATTDVATHIWLYSNFFKKRIFIAEGGEVVQIKWLSANDLLIRHAFHPSKIFLQENILNELHILYQQY